MYYEEKRNFGDGDCGAGKIDLRACEILRRLSTPDVSRFLKISHVCVYFICPTIVIATVRDYSQSIKFGVLLVTLIFKFACF